MEKMLQRQTLYFFAHKTLQFLFSQVELFLNGKVISRSNNFYHHAALVETELTTDPVSKRTWTACQGYRYHPKKKNLEKKDNIIKKLADNDSCSLYQYGAPNVEFLHCKRLLLPSVKLDLRLHSSHNHCALETLTDLDSHPVKRLHKVRP